MSETQSASGPGKQRKRPSRTWYVLAGIALGIAAGLILHHAGARGAILAADVKPLGLLWLNALRMTLVPLVFCLMATGVASVADSASGGRIMATTLIVFAALLLAAGFAGVAVADALLRLWPIGQIHSGAAAAQLVSPLGDQLLSLIPTNPIAAAADSAMTPLIVFAAIFGAAITRLNTALRKLLLDVLQATSSVLLVIIDWVLWLAPFGLFFLVLNSVASFGAGASATLLGYMLMLSLILCVATVCAVVLGMASAGPLRFLRAALPAQVLAASTQSSMACLPALIAAAEILGIDTALIDAVMPLAVSTFRFGNVFAAVSSGLIGAYIFGVHPTAAQICLAIVISIATNVGSVGIPGQAVLLAAFGPVYLALGTPLEALVLLIGVFTLPDVLDTVCNVSADLAATALIARLCGRDRLALPSGPAPISAAPLLDEL